MHIYKGKTDLYYKSNNLSVCDCDYCQYFIKNIKKYYPKICNYLKKYRIDPLKPFELIYYEDKQQIKYFDCMYIVFGKADNDFYEKIDDIEFFINVNFHPDTKINEDHFVLSFGTICLNMNNEI